jgi:choline dehydrogenase
LISHTVDPRYLTTEFELLLHSNATKLSRLFFQTPPISGIITAETQPGSAVSDTNNDTQWQDFVISNVSPVLHPIGTNAMLPREDGGVVDPDLLVYGTTNVRVVGKYIDFERVTEMLSPHFQIHPLYLFKSVLILVPLFMELLKR